MPTEPCRNADRRRVRDERHRVARRYRRELGGASASDRSRATRARRSPGREQRADASDDAALDLWSRRELRQDGRGVLDVASDLWLTAESRLRLIADPRLPAPDISVDCRDQTVTLFGEVASERPSAPPSKTFVRSAVFARSRTSFRSSPPRRGHRPGARPGARAEGARSDLRPSRDEASVDLGRGA